VHFAIVVKPAATPFAGNPMRTLTLVASCSARYGDPERPANRRCADRFTGPELWGTNYYGNGGDEEAALSFEIIWAKKGSRTLIVTLDALHHTDAANLAETRAA
jgi:hypothetical protein